MSVFVLQGACLHAATFGSMSRHSSVDFPFSCSKMFVLHHDSSKICKEGNCDKFA